MFSLSCGGSEFGWGEEGDIGDGFIILGLIIWGEHGELGEWTDIDR